MKCPDCGGALNVESLMGTDQSQRCYTCGGFWVQGWVVNRMAVRSVDKYRPIPADPQIYQLGTNMCPIDGTYLKRFTGESVPENLPVKRCERCGWWWWPADSLLRYKPAQEAKINYFKLWGKMADAAALVLPGVAVLILGAGVWMGVELVKMKQQVGVPAREAGITNFAATYVGEGIEVVSFRSKSKIVTIEYKKTQETSYGVQEVARRGDIYEAKLKVEEGGRYIVRVWGRTWEFEAR